MRSSSLPLTLRSTTTSSSAVIVSRPVSTELLVIAPDRPPAELPHALIRGLLRDVDRCHSEQNGIAVLVEPTEEPR